MLTLVVKVSPLHADLNDMPPAQFIAGTADPLIDDSLFMHARWLAAGNQATLALYAGGVHAFNLLPLGIAQNANRQIAEFIDSIVTEG